MRILLTSCDRLGDAVLRQPLLAALQAAGHELLILAWDPVIPLLEQLVPQARIKGIGADPYIATLHQNTPFTPDLSATISAFAPELLVVGPYQWTILEEFLAAQFPTVPRIGMNGHCFTSPGQNPTRCYPPLALQRVVMVTEAMHELEKNALLCQAILGNTTPLPDPVLQPTAGQLEQGKKWLGEQGLTPENYWVACVGTTNDYYGKIKDWGPQRWVLLLQNALEKYPQGICLIGSPAEVASLRELQQKIKGGSRVVVAETSGAGFDQLIGLSALAHGYIGRDTGPLHIAAALGKRVLAIFGQGHWLQFVPAVSPSCVLSVPMPCAGCGWNCLLSEPVCLRQVPVEDAIAALADLEGGRIRQRDIRLSQPTAGELEAYFKDALQLRLADIKEISHLQQDLQHTQELNHQLQKRLTALTQTPSRRLMVRLGLLRKYPWEQTPG